MVTTEDKIKCIEKYIKGFEEHGLSNMVNAGNEEIKNLKEKLAQEQVT